MKCSVLIGFRAALIVCLCISVSCSTSPKEVEQIETEALCNLQENIGKISQPMSFAMTSDGGFVLCDFNKIYLYSKDGKQIRQIGRPGRAKFEYNHPMDVAVYNDTIYVWSSYTATFIAYTLDGTPIAQYRYKSAITNFEPSEDAIYIYTGGRAYDNVIDVYSKTEKKVIKSLTKATDEHRLLLFNLTASPLLYDGKQLYYSSMDALDVYTYGADNLEPELFSKIESETFRVEDGDMSLWQKQNRSKHQDYINSNSQVLNIFRDNGDLYVMTLEGVSRLVNDKYDAKDRFFSVYKVSGRKNHVASYAYDSIDTALLFDSTSDGLYFIKHSIENGEDVYTLNKLVLD